MNVTRHSVEVKRSHRGFLSIDLESIVLPNSFSVKEKNVFYIPPNEYGGNHSHPRTEAFIGLGDLEISWKHEGEIVTEHMFTNEKPQLYIIPPHIPHIVRNLSLSQFAILIEYADGPQTHVTKANFTV